ncbi:DUF2913 family protein [Vibrio sp. SG41-7]|uniref:DUF2913 family protein n=1 Tax=Vibrio sp. SG41-7 TaxID=2760973 RepID=UPI0016035BC7|nr:DUF2913 family protein [Vibrio sp. SG41-7]MBB1465947.1 DUF2913 family protein [Vibrio sp. SG41-7]
MTWTKHRNLKHYQALNELIPLSLIALYSTVNISGGFWSVKRRNAFLTKYLKPKVKLPQFIACKQELKALLIIGRSLNGNLEQKLLFINKANLDYETRWSHADELYILFSKLSKQHQFGSKIKCRGQKMEPDIIYMNSDAIEKGFDAQNNQIKPLSITLKTSRLHELISAIREFGKYQLEEIGINDTAETHMLLSRK